MDLYEMRDLSNTLGLMVELWGDAWYEYAHQIRMRILGGRSRDEIEIPRYTEEARP